MILFMALLTFASSSRAQEAAQKPAALLAAPPMSVETPAPAVKPVAYETLLQRLRYGGPAARKEALRALGQPGNVRAVPELGALALQLNAPADVRVAAVMALGRVRNWRAATFLKQTLKDSSRDVRFASALSLGKAKAPGSLPALTEALAKDADWWVRFAAAVALGEDTDPKSVSALAVAAERDSEWQVRIQAVRSLGQIGSRDAAYALAKPLRDKDAVVRAAAAQALGGIGGLDSINILAAALHDETDALPRQAMSEAIKKLLARP